jgi:hypothetical protein
MFMGFIFIIEDSTADTSPIQNCPDPNALPETTTQAYPTKGKLQKGQITYPSFP